MPPTRVRTVDLPGILGPWCDRNGVELVVDLVDPIPRDLDLLGFMLHHDVSAAGAFRERTTRTIKFGHTKLKGPLANLHVPRNPDPEQWVAMGQRTTDEMSHAWIAITHLDEEGYQRLVAEREAKPIVMGDVR